MYLIVPDPPTTHRFSHLYIYIFVQLWSFQNLFGNKALPKAFYYLTQAENVLLTPHIAGWTIESKIKLAQTIVTKTKDFMSIRY